MADRATSWPAIAETIDALKAEFEAAPRFVCGCHMPASSTIEDADRQRRLDARLGSEALEAAIKRYFRSLVEG